MAARKDAARPRRPRAAAPRPLTEAQLDEVRRAVLALSGTGARSLSKHGIVVYFDNGLTLPKPSCQSRAVPTPALEGAPNAATTRLDGVPSTSRQRRSRRRLQERIEQRAAAHVQERPTPPPAGDDGLAAMRAALLRTQSAAEEPIAPNLPLPDPKTPEVPGSQGEGGPKFAALWPMPAECSQPAAAEQSTGRAGVVTSSVGDKGSSPMRIDACARLAQPGRGLGGPRDRAKPGVNRQVGFLGSAGRSS